MWYTDTYTYCYTDLILKGHISKSTCDKLSLLSLRSVKWHFSSKLTKKMVNRDRNCADGNSGWPRELWVTGLTGILADGTDGKFGCLGDGTNGNSRWLELDEFPSPRMWLGLAFLIKYIIVIRIYTWYVAFTSSWLVIRS